MTVLRDVGDAIEGERVVCEYREPRKLSPKRFAQSSGHRIWRIEIQSAYCVIEKRFRWLRE